MGFCWKEGGQELDEPAIHTGTGTHRGHRVLRTGRRGAPRVIRLAAGWHGIGELGAGPMLGAIFVVVLSAAAWAWWLERRGRDRER